jgi:hypothetical protein
MNLIIEESICLKKTFLISLQWKRHVESEILITTIEMAVIGNRSSYEITNYASNIYFVSW